MIKTRFAPSPTGYLHLGNLRTALFNALCARREGGVFLLRIEDTDLERSEARYTAALLEDLRWLGLQWGEGPEAGGAHGPYAQSERGAIYREYYRHLEQAGLAYPCFCSEQQLALSRKLQRAAGQPPRYAGNCAHLTPQEAAAKLAQGLRPTLRFRVPAGRAVAFDDAVRGPQQLAAADIGDFIIRRADGTPAFFFTNAVDDALMGVTLVLRGEDHLTNTPRQLLILEALGLPAPRYGHISLIVGDDGTPLSKRHGARSIRRLREEGFLPGAVLNYLARLGHRYDGEEGFLGLDGLAAGFALERLGRAPARYDEGQLLHWQREAVARCDEGDLRHWLGGRCDGRVAAGQWSAFVELVRPNVLFPAEAERWAEILFGDAVAPSAEAQAAIADAGPAFFAAALAAFDAHGADFKALSEAVKRATGRKGKGLFLPLRAALTGEAHGPEMGRMLPLMAPERLRRRLAGWAAGAA